MTATQVVAQLKKWGVRYKEVSGWKTRNRGERGNGWSNLNGFMVHHTGSDSKDQIALLRDGYQSLPGPLCHFGLAQDGTVYLIGWGRANHAGSGDKDVYRAVVNENYGARPPSDNDTSVDGNGHFYGVEIWYSGSHGMTPQQYSSLLKLASAVLDFHNWTEKSVIGHGEWQPGKWDPGYKSGTMMDMSAVRNDVRDTLRGGSKPPAKPEPKPEPKPKPKPASKAHRAVKGDTLWSIAEKYLGDGNKWPEIVKANPDLFPVQVGQSYKIPGK